MGLELKDVLDLPPREAAKRIVIAACQPGLTSSQIRLIRKDLTRGPDILLQVVVDYRNTPISEWHYTGGADFSYRRLHWSDIFGKGELTLPIDPPTHVKDILPALSAHAGVLFDDDDVHDHTVYLRRDGSYELIANPSSWRWYGSMMLRFSGAPSKTLTVQDEPWKQHKDPGRVGFFRELRELNRGGLVTAVGRRWCRWLNHALDQSDQWVIDTTTPSPYNVGGARVLTNAKVDTVPEGIPVQGPAYRLMVALDRRLCLDMAGVITIYYTDPEVPHA